MLKDLGVTFGTAVDIWTNNNYFVSNQYTKEHDSNLISFESQETVLGWLHGTLLFWMKYVKWHLVHQIWRLQWEWEWLIFISGVWLRGTGFEFLCKVPPAGIWNPTYRNEICIPASKDLTKIIEINT